MARDQSPLLLPGGLRVDPGVMREPSPETQLLAGILQHIAFLIGGNPNTGELGLSQLLQGVQMQLDTLIRMESQETSRNEVKRRIQKADAVEEIRRAEAVEAADREAAEPEVGSVETEVDAVVEDGEA